MRELYEMAVDDLRQTLAQAADEYCRAEDAALREVAAAVEHWLSDVWRRMPCNEWRQEWNALVDDFQARGINLIEPSTTDIGRLLETWNQWHIDRQQRATAEKEAKDAELQDRLERRGRTIMAGRPPEEWLHRARIAVTAMQLPEELEARFLLWIEEEQRAALERQNWSRRYLHSSPPPNIDATLVQPPSVPDAKAPPVVKFQGFVYFERVELKSLGVTEHSIEYFKSHGYRKAHGFFDALQQLGINRDQVTLEDEQVNLAGVATRITAVKWRATGKLLYYAVPEIVKTWAGGHVYDARQDSLSLIPFVGSQLGQLGEEYLGDKVVGAAFYQELSDVRYNLSGADRLTALQTLTTVYGTGVGAHGVAIVKGSTSIARQRTLRGRVPVNHLKLNPSKVVRFRTQELQEAIPTNSRGRITMSVAVLEDSQGARKIVIASSEPQGYLRPGVTLKPGETLVSGNGHAESRIVRYAQANNLKVVDIGATRPVCPGCQDVIGLSGANISTSLKRK